MATTKKATAGKTRGSKRTGTTTTKIDVARTDPKEIERLIARMKSVPTEKQRRAWLTQYPLALTQKWAGKTTAAKTELEAFNWASEAAPLVLHAELAPALSYPPARLVFLLECVQDVAAERSRARAGAPELTEGKLERGAAASAADVALAELNSALRSAAASHPERVDEIRTALARAVPATDAGARIDALAAVADRWTGGTDEDLALLCEERRVAELAQSARAAAERLRAGRSAVAGKANADKDSAEVNVSEARMLGEMAALRSAIRRARRRTGDKRYVLLKPIATATIFVKGGEADDEEPGGGEGGEK